MNTNTGLALLTATVAFVGGVNSQHCTMPNHVVHNWDITREMESCGWTRCYFEVYAHNTNVANLRSTCPDGADVYHFMGAQPNNNSAALSIGAYGPASVLHSDTPGLVGNSLAVKPPKFPDGVFWYNSPIYSMGFAPVAEVRLTQADTLSTYDDDRLSWHTLAHVVGGWRAGAVKNLNGDRIWMKVMYFKHCASVSEGESCANDIATDSPTVSPTNSPTLSPTTYHSCKKMCHDDEHSCKKSCHEQFKGHSDSSSGGNNVNDPRDTKHFCDLRCKDSEYHCLKDNCVKPPSSDSSSSSN